jgi:hypothetical protein
LSHQIIKEQFYKNKASWIKSLDAGISQDENGNFVPWMTYPAIEFLKKNINENSHIFEYGCGASTLFFSKITDHLISLETNPKWLKIISEKLPKNAKNQIFLNENGLTDKNYENFAKNYAKKHNQKFDFLIIDSLKRFNCSKEAIFAIKNSGTIILDDSERKNYQKIFDFFAENGFKKQVFIGIAPGQTRLKNTTIFFK